MGKWKIKFKKFFKILGLGWLQVHRMNYPQQWP